MAAGIFALNRVFSFSQLFCLFWEKKISSGIYRRFSVRSVLVFNVSLFTSVVCYCQNELRRKHGKCSLCNEWWHSFMNQRLNHFVLLCKKCNCIRIMSLNTYNKNVDIIWHYCIISQIKLHGFWKRSAFTNMKKNTLKYMINRLWYGIFHITCHISPRDEVPRANMGVSGWYDMWYEKCHILIYNYRPMKEYRYRTLSFILLWSGRYFILQCISIVRIKMIVHRTV